MRPVAFTASLLMHAGLFAAVLAWRPGAPAAAQRAGDGERAMDFSFLTESAATEPMAGEEIVAVVEFTPPVEPPATPVEASIEPVAIALTEALAATPTALASAVPAATAKPPKRSASRSTGSLPRGAGAGGGSGGGSGYQPPRYRICPAPPYPALARAQKLEGAALLLVLVDDSGRPTKVTLRRSSGSLVLDDAAIRAVWAWRFEPARAGGQAIAASVEVPIRFRYRG